MAQNLTEAFFPRLSTISKYPLPRCPRVPVRGRAVLPPRRRSRLRWRRGEAWQWNPTRCLVDQDANLIEQFQPGRLYSYDAFNRLRVANVSNLVAPPPCNPDVAPCEEYEHFDTYTATYTYDALNRRISRTENTFEDGDPVSRTTTFLYDGWNLIETRNATDTVRFVHGDGVDEHIGLNRGGAWHYYVQDRLGSVMGLADASGDLVEAYLYQPYGAPTVIKPGQNGVLDWGGDDELTSSWIGLEQASDLNPFLFTGQPYESALGLYYYRARFYDPEQGRFLTRDPIGVWGDRKNLGNAYAYVADDPLNGRDPYGLCGWSPWAWGDCMADAREAAWTGLQSAGAWVGQKCLGNWQAAAKCGLVLGAAVVGGFAVTVGAPAFLIGGAIAVGATFAFDCFNGDGCLSDSLGTYAGAAVAGMLFAGGTAASGLRGLGLNMLRGFGAGVGGNFAGQFIDWAWGPLCGLDPVQLAMAGLWGMVGGAIGSVKLPANWRFRAASNVIHGGEQAALGIYTGAPAGPQAKFAFNAVVFAPHFLSFMEGLGGAVAQGPVLNQLENAPQGTNC